MSLPPLPKDESLSQDYLQKLTNLTGNDRTGVWLHGCLCVGGMGRLHGCFVFGDGGGGGGDRHACFIEPNMPMDVFMLGPSY